MKTGRIGFLGGTFDPVHNGHLAMAEDSLEALSLDRVLFVPAAQSPLKDAEPVAASDERIAMLRIALEGKRRIEVLDLELKKGGVSYTIDTVERLRGRFPDSRLFWLIGADQVVDLPRWHRIEELVTRIDFAYVPRPGFAETIPSIRGLRLHRVEGRYLDISSSQLRRRLREGRDVDLLLPEKVLYYIGFNKLYIR